MKATVTVHGDDPHGLGPKCRVYCRTELADAHDIGDAAERRKLADQLLRRFLGTLPVSVIPSTRITIDVEL